MSSVWGSDSCTTSQVGSAAGRVKISGQPAASKDWKGGKNSERGRKPPGGRAAKQPSGQAAKNGGRWAVVRPTAECSWLIHLAVLLEG